MHTLLLRVAEVVFVRDLLQSAPAKSVQTLTTVAVLFQCLYVVVNVAIRDLLRPLAYAIVACSGSRVCQGSIAKCAREVGPDSSYCRSLVSVSVRCC